MSESPGSSPEQLALELKAAKLEIEALERELQSRSVDAQRQIARGERLLREITDASSTPGRVIGVETSAHDVTAHKRAEAELRDVQERLVLAMEQSQLAYWELDAATQAFTFNDRFYAFYGTTAEREGGYRMTPDAYARDFLPEEDASVVGESVSTLLAGKVDTLTHHHRIRRRDGALRDIIVRINVVRDAAGEVLGARGCNQDVTELRRAESDRAQLEARLRDAEKLESIGRLAGGVAHDFNNMLGVILGNVELLLEAEPPGARADDLEEIRQAATRSAELTRQLLAFARRQTATPKVLDLNDTVAKMTKMLQRLIGENVRLSFAPRADLWPVHIDPSQVDQLLANLCVNARDAIHGTGSVVVETDNCTVGENPDGPPGDYVRVRVRDDGSGMDAETQKHIFEPFFTTKDVGRGTGLGLATVFGVVKQNGGFITVASELGRSSVFCVYLPRHQGVAEASPSALATATAPGRETVLVVEDEALVLKLVTRVLERAGYRVVATSTAREALELVRERPRDFRLLLTDVMMPEMNGKELALALLAIAPDLQCLFMSGYTADVMSESGDLPDAAHFLQKPFTPQALTAKLRTLLDPSPARLPPD